MNNRDYRPFFKLNNGIGIYKKKNPRFLNANAIVEFEEWPIASIIRVGRSRRGVKTLLWITEYITKSFVIHYEGFELSQCHELQKKWMMDDTKMTKIAL